MSVLSDIRSWWASKSALTDLIPVDRVYMGMIPENTPMEYAVIIPISTVPTWTTGRPYIEDYDFQISIYALDLDTLETIAQAVRDSFDFQAISDSIYGCVRKNSLSVAENAGPYSCHITYTASSNRNLPS